MRRLPALFAVLLLGCPPDFASAAATQRYDGTWQTTVSCAAARDALGYSFRFISMVKNGVLHGQHGTPGQASSLQIDGSIEADGSGKLYAKGFTGSKEYVPGRDTPSGTEYGYDIDARFGQSTGTGTRTEGHAQGSGPWTWLRKRWPLAGGASTCSTSADRESPHRGSSRCAR